VPASREPTRGALLRRHPRVVGAVAILGVLAVVVALLGGFARRTPDSVRVVRPGVEVDVTPLRVRLDRASASYEVAGRPAEPGRVYVAIEGTLALDDRESVGSGLVDDAFSVDLRAYEFDELRDDAKPSVQVARDGSSLQGLGPGLTYEVLLVYEVDEAAVPATVTVSLRRHTRRPSSLNVSEIGWHDPATFAQVELAVAPLSGERPEEAL
jgi:hypothetical protein